MYKYPYATYLIEGFLGTDDCMGMHACSEQNNWSVISHLNPGVAKGSNTSCKHPMTLIKDFRQ
jgi:hypothetical protein